MDRRPAADRVAGVQHGLAGERIGARELQGVERDRSTDREHDDFAKFRSLREGDQFCARVLALPLREFGRFASAQRDLWPCFSNPAPSVCATTPDPMIADFHLSSPPALRACRVTAVRTSGERARARKPRRLSLAPRAISRRSPSARNRPRG